MTARASRYAPTAVPRRVTAWRLADAPPRVWLNGPRMSHHVRHPSRLRTGLAVCLAALAGDAAATAEPERVGRWERYERTVENRRAYTDPYGDVELEVVYTGPDGVAVPFRGFHDGGTTWRIRFMPGRVGPWTWRARFSDGSGEAAGAFECVPSSVPGLVSRHAPNPIWFGFEGGEAALLRSLHVGDRFFARNWPEASRARFLDWAQARGYDTLSVASSFLNRDRPGRGRGWATPRLWPLDAAEFRRLEGILDELARRRMVVYPFAGFFGRDAAWPRDPAGQRLYVRYALARLGPYWNLLLNVAGPEPEHPESAFLGREELRRLALLVHEADPFGHLLSVHNPTGPDLYRDEPWTSYGILQGPKTSDRARLGREIRESRHPTKPLYAQETLWPGNRYQLLEHEGRDFTDADIRKNAWVVLMSAAALNFGDMSGDSSSGLSGSLDPADAVESRHAIVRAAWDFLGTVPFARMRPCPERVGGGHCLASPAASTSSTSTARGRSRSGSRPARPTASSGSTAGTRRSGFPPATPRATRVLEPPPGGDDWLLRLRRR